MRSISTADESAEIDRAVGRRGVADADAVDQHQSLAGIRAAQADLGRRADAARLVDVEPGDAAQHVGDALGPEFFDFGDADDRHRGGGLADRLLDAVGSDGDVGQIVGASVDEGARRGGRRSVETASEAGRAMRL